MSPLRPPPPGMVDLRAAGPPGCLPLRFAVAYAGPENFSGAALPGYGAPGAWLRAPAAEGLRQAQRAISAEGLGLIIFDAYRPVRATEGMWAWAERVGQTALFDQGWIARRSRHNTGVAVDLALYRPGEPPLDHGSPFDAFDARSFWGAEVPAAAQALRLRLRIAMTEAGFRPYDQEWWHFEAPVEGAARCDVPYGADEPDGALSVP